MYNETTMTPQENTLMQRGKKALREAADRVPLPLHYILDFLLFIFWLGDLFVFDPLPLIDEFLGAGALYYYNAYIMRRTFGVINPVRIVRGDSPARKRTAGLLPYENKLSEIKKQLRNIKKAAGRQEVPGLTPAKVSELSAKVKGIEKRLRLLDRVLFGPAFQQGPVRAELARIEALAEETQDPELTAEYQKAAASARDQLDNIERVREERNRLVARLERISLQVANTYSHLISAAVSEARDQEAGRAFDELLSSVSNFDSSLQEIESAPAGELFKRTLKEVEHTQDKTTKTQGEREKAVE